MERIANSARAARAQSLDEVEDAQPGMVTRLHSFLSRRGNSSLRSALEQLSGWASSLATPDPGCEQHADSTMADVLPLSAALRKAPAASVSCWLAA